MKKWGVCYLLRGGLGVLGRWALRARGMGEAFGPADVLRDKPLGVGCLQYISTVLLLVSAERFPAS